MGFFFSLDPTGFCVLNISSYFRSFMGISWSKPKAYIHYFGSGLEFRQSLVGKRIEWNFRRGTSGLRYRPSQTRPTFRVSSQYFPDQKNSKTVVVCLCPFYTVNLFLKLARMPVEPCASTSSPYEVKTDMTISAFFRKSSISCVQLKKQWIFTFFTGMLPCCRVHFHFYYMPLPREYRTITFSSRPIPLLAYLISYRYTISLHCRSCPLSDFDVSTSSQTLIWHNFPNFLQYFFSYNQ